MIIFPLHIYNEILWNSYFDDTEILDLHYRLFSFCSIALFLKGEEKRERDSRKSNTYSSVLSAILVHYKILESQLIKEKHQI